MCVHAHASALARAHTPSQVCAYANNQHALGGDLTIDPAQSSFRRAMTLTVGTLAIVDTSSVVYTRSWCGYETSTSLRDIGAEYKFDMVTALPHKGKNVVGKEFPNAAVGLYDGFTEADRCATAAIPAGQCHFF